MDILDQHDANASVTLSTFLKFLKHGCGDDIEFDKIARADIG